MELLTETLQIRISISKLLHFTLLKLNASVIIPENKKIKFGLLYYINYICRKCVLIAKMMKRRDHRETEIMSRFNRKDAVAFSDVYDLLYKPLYYFAFNLYKDTPVDANDVIHDVFIMIWEHKKLSFENYTSLKTFLYITIKNRFRNHLVHQRCEIKYSESVKKTYAERSLTSEIVEVETLSIIQEAMKVLPEECAKVFELHVNGWSVKEIAEKLGKSQCTVYTQRQDAITILKKRMSKDQMYIILLLIS